MRFPKIVGKDGIEKPFKGRYVNAELGMSRNSDRQVVMLVDKVSDYPAKELEFLGPIKAQVTRTGLSAKPCSKKKAVVTHSIKLVGGD